MADVTLVAGVGGVYTVHVHRDRFHRSSSIRSVNHACAFGPQVAGGTVMCRRRTPNNIRPWYLRQLGPANEILIRWIRTRRRCAIEETAVRSSGRSERREREDGSRTGDRDDSVQGAEVGGQRSVVFRGVEEKLGKALGGVRWGGGKSRSECRLNGVEEGEEWWWERVCRR